MSGIGDNIIVNDFMFCTRHGLEYCYHCTCDHRLVNNIRIEDELGAVFPGQELGELDFELDERQVIDCYAAGAIQHNNTESYKCRTHQTVDCGKCFDWVKMISEEIMAAEKDKKWLEKRRKWLERTDS